MGSEMGDSIAGDEVPSDSQCLVECRACLSKTSQSSAIDIFSTWTWKFEKYIFTSTIAMELEKLTKVEIPNTEGYPDHVCQKCEAWLQGAIMLTKDVKKSENVLKSRVGTWPKPIELDKSVNVEIIKLPDDVEIKQENVSEDDPIDDGMDDAQNNMDTDDVDIKEEPEDITEVPAIQVTVNDEDTDDDNDPLIISQNEEQPRKRSSKKERGSKHFKTKFWPPTKISQLRLRLEKSSESIRPACNCKKTCSEKFSDVMREHINLHFWSLKQVDKFKFLLRFTVRTAPKYWMHSRISRKQSCKFIYQYYLPLNNFFDDTSAKIQVCKVMFDNTLLIAHGVVIKFWERYCSNKQKNVMTAKSKKPKINNTEKNDGAKITSKVKWVKTERQTTITKSVQKKHLQKCSNSDSIKSLIKDKLHTKEEVENMCFSKEPRVVLTKIGSAHSNFDPNSFKVEIEVDLNTKESLMYKQGDNPKNNKLENIASCDDSDYSNFSDEYRNEENKTGNDLVESADISDADLEALDSDMSNIDITREEQKTIRSTRQNPDLNSELNIPEFPKDLIEKIEQGQIKELLTEKKKQPTKDPAVIRKYCKSHGLEYVTITGKVIPKKVLLPKCSCKQLKCSKYISDDRRQQIFQYYWGLGDKKRQANFIFQFTEKLPNHMKRGYIFKCFLPISDNLDTSADKVRVCTKMFCNTIGCSSCILLDSWRKYSNEQQSISSDGVHNINTYDQKATGSNFDNTYIDFVYKAMPFHEFIAYFSSRKATYADEIPIGEAANDVISKPSKKAVDNMRRKLLGKSYVTKQGVSIGERKLGPSCDCTMMHCGTKILEEQRRFIFEFYWGLGDAAKQRAFTIRFTRKACAKRPRPRITNNEKPRMTYEYFLPLTKDFDGEQVKVCKVMFQNTLAIGERMIHTTWSKFAHGTLEETRGRNHRKMILEKLKPQMVEGVVDHFNSLLNDDPDMKRYKTNTSHGSRFMFNVIYRDYLKWLNTSKYGSTVNNAYKYRNIIEGKYDKYFKPQE